MPRARLIHPGAPKDEEVASMSMAARLAWAYLPCHADREGRFEDKPFGLRLEIFPCDPGVDMDAVLAELSGAGLVVRYVMGGRRYAQIKNFLKYQSPHKQEQPSRIPPPPSDDAPIMNGASSEHVPNITGAASEHGSNGVRAGSEALALDPVGDPVGDPVRTERARADACAPARDPSAMTGGDLQRLYAEARSRATGGRSLPWVTPRASTGKASDFADALDASAVADLPAALDRHFTELRSPDADERQRKALKDPTFGFGVFCAEFTRLREAVRGQTAKPAQRYRDLPTPPAPKPRTPEERAEIERLAAEHGLVRHKAKPAPMPVPAAGQSAEHRARVADLEARLAKRNAERSDASGAVPSSQTAADTKTPSLAQGRGLPERDSGPAELAKESAT